MASTINAKTTGVGGIDASGDASGILQLQTGGTAALTIDTSQNVGIGMTAQAVSKLDVNGSVRFLQDDAPTSGAIVLRQSSGDTYPAYIQWVNNANTAERGYITIDTSQNVFINTGNTNRLVINSVGNVGIGTASPAVRLHVADTNPVLIIQNTGSTTGNGVMRFQGSGGTNQAGIGTNVNTGDVGNLEFLNGSTTNMRLSSSGALLVTGTIDATSVSSGGFGIRVRAGTSNTFPATIQFTNNAAGSDWAYISSTQADSMIIRTTLGSSSLISSNNAEFNFYGGHAVIRAVTSAGGDIGDWPQPVLALTGYDSNFGYQTFQTFALRDDAAAYQTGASVWNFRMYQGSTGQTTSNSNTALELTGPGPLHMQAGGSNGVQLTNGATSWSAWSDERMKDIIEPIENAVEKVSTLRTVIGKYKTDADGIRRSMLIAQDVEKVLPEAVSLAKHIDPIDENDIYKLPEENERLALAYTEVIPLLTAAIKELTERIKVLENK